MRNWGERTSLCECVQRVHAAPGDASRPSPSRGPRLEASLYPHTHQLFCGISRCPAPSPKAPVSSLLSLSHLWSRGSPRPHLTTSPPLPHPVAPQLLPLRLPKGSSGRPGPAHCRGRRVQLVILATHLHFSRWVQKVEPGSSPPWRRDNLCRTTPLSKGAMPSPRASHSQ